MQVGQFIRFTFSTGLYRIDYLDEQTGKATLYNMIDHFPTTEYIRTIDRWISTGHVTIEPVGMYTDVCRCKGCNDVHDVTAMHHHQSHYYCNACYAVEFRTCEHCNIQNHRTNMRDWNNHTYCRNCREAVSVICTGCQTRYSVEDMNLGYRERGMNICNNCSSNYTECDECHQLTLLENMAGDECEDENICNSCRDNRVGQPIQSYRFKPDAIFHGDNERKFGIELEVDDGGTSKYNAKRLLEIANGENGNNCVAPYMYIKEDGSISDGFELVTHPCDYDTHMDDFPWAKVLKAAQDMGYTGHNNGTCGLHLHVSKVAFGATDQIRRENIGKAIHFIEKFWNEMLRFSRRTKDSVQRYANRYGYALTPNEMFDMALRAERYKAVNLQNEHTVELRFFRSTLNVRTFRATLQFTDAMVNMATSLTFQQLQDMTWDSFVDTYCKPYKELTDYLVIRRLSVRQTVKATV